MTTRQMVTTQEDFSGGSQRDTAPHLIDRAGTWDILNMVLDDDGSAYRRGGSQPWSTNAMTARGRFLFDGILNVGRRTICADAGKTYVLDSDDQTLITMDAATGMPYPRQTAVMKGLLFGGGGWITAGARSSTIHTATSVVQTTFGSRTVTRSGGSWSSAVVPGHLMKIGNGRLYEVETVNSGTSLTLREPYQGTSLTGQTASFYPIYRHVNGDPYDGAEYVCVVHNRLVYAAGRIVKFSAIDNPHSFPTDNYHELPLGGEITGIKEMGGRLIVFTTDGIWTIDGLAFEIVDANGNGQHRVQQLSEGIYLAGIAGVAGYENRLIVPDADGIWLIDGVSSPQRISKGIERPYQAWLRGGYRFGQAVVFKGHYLLPIVSPQGRTRDMFICRIDREIRTRFRDSSWAWVRFDGDGGEVPAFAIRHGDEELTPRLIGVQGRDGAKIVNCSDFFNPQSPVDVDCDGSPITGQITTRDFETGNLTVNSVRAVRLRYELVGGSVKVEHGPGGVNYDEAGYANPLRFWDDPDALWDHADGLWDLGFGPADPDVISAPVSSPHFDDVGSLGESDGIVPVKVRINKRVRYSRLRFTCTGSVKIFRLRAIELFTRPSKAVRV